MTYKTQESPLSFNGNIAKLSSALVIDILMQIYLLSEQHNAYFNPDTSNTKVSNKVESITT